MAARTPLYEVHRRLGARLVDFAGWEMPVAYGDAAEEHHAVRSACGLFDVSHMGELRVRGRDAGRLWQRIDHARSPRNGWNDDVPRDFDHDHLRCHERAGCAGVHVDHLVVQVLAHTGALSGIGC